MAASNKCHFLTARGFVIIIGHLTFQRSRAPRQNQSPAATSIPSHSVWVILDRRNLSDSVSTIPLHAPRLPARTSPRVRLVPAGRSSVQTGQLHQIEPARPMVCGRWRVLNMRSVSLATKARRRARRVCPRGTPSFGIRGHTSAGVSGAQPPEEIARDAPEPVLR